MRGERMRWMAIGLTAAALGWHAAAAQADDETKRVVGNVVTGLLGGQPQQQQQAYTAQEQARLVSLLQGGEYVTSRQGETVDMMVYGVPLTHVSHVYTAKPIPPSSVSGNYQQPR